MSFETAWVLPKDVDAYDSGDLCARVRACLPTSAATTISGDHDARTLRVGFRASEVDAVAAALAKRDGELAHDWRQQMDPPRSGDAYELHVDIVDDERPLIRVYSNDADNREAWPLAVSIASCLADELGAVPEEDAPSSDRIPMFIAPTKASKPN